MAATAYGLRTEEQRSASGSFRYYKVILPDVTPIPEDLTLAGSWMVTKIRERTTASMDVNKAPFAPYSPRYSFQKGSSIVNLIGDVNKNTGNHMIDSITHQEESLPGGCKLEVGIFNNERNATLAEINNEGAVLRTRYRGSEGGRFRAKKEWVTIPRRHFLDFSPEDLNQITTIAAHSILRRVLGEENG